MKLRRILYLMAMLVICMSASAIAPKTETFCRWMRILDIQPNDTSLRLTVRLQNRPGFWVNVPSSSRLISVDNPELQFKLISSDNLPLDEHIWMPESGCHDGVLIFEKVPQDVKVVDLVTESKEEIGDNILGIHIYEPASAVRPEMLTLSDILTGGIPPEEWTGLDPKKYRDLEFYNKEGTTLLKGKITDYSPRSGVTTFSVRSNDDFVGSEKMNVGNIAADGTFELEVPSTYPQRCFFSLGNIAKSIYLIPGDTLEIVTCMATGNDYKPDFFGFIGSKDDGAVVNVLSDSLLNERYGLNDMFRYALLPDTETLKEETYSKNELLAQKLDSIITDLPLLLRDLPVSNFVKDLLSAETIAQVCEAREDLRLYFNDKKGSRFVPDEEGKYSYVEGEHLDQERLLTPVRKHFDLIYDNPLIVANGMILVNRFEYNDIFHELGMAARGFEKSPEIELAYIQADDVSLPMRRVSQYLDSIGVGNCFMTHLLRNKGFLEYLSTLESPTYTRLETVSRLLPVLIQNNTVSKFNSLLMDNYNEFVKDVMIAENAISADSGKSILLEDSAGADVLEKIIAPYEGNVLYLDFWGLGCGPCRVGMMNQKPLLEQLSDQPFKALYIANINDGLEGMERWLRKEDIKGEHIFVTSDDWNRLCGLFNFSGIPFGVLVGKDGKVIEKHFSFYLDNPALKKALAQ